MIRLSIIIPYYNKDLYIKDLLDCLDKQMTKEVEVIIIDDGSRIPLKTDYKWAKITRTKNHGCSAARNLGIDKAKGAYISFVDADDLVSGDFVAKILEKTKCEDYDIIEFSWRSLTKNMWCCDVKLNAPTDRQTNPSVCTRVFNRAFIGDTRFNTKKDTTEDEDFSRRIGYLDHENCFKVGIITDYMYFYRDEVPMSKTKRYAAGIMNTKKVVYYFDHVTKDMDWLYKEIQKEDETNEVWLMTKQCDIPEITRWCRVIKPRKEWGHIIRGEKTDLLTLKKPPYKTQVVIYRKNVNTVGGLRTFFNHFIDYLGESYDITLLCATITERSYKEFSKKVRVITAKIKNETDGSIIPLERGDFADSIVCDTLIVPSFLDALPTNVSAGQVIRMCHACKTEPDWKIPKDYDKLLYVSETAMRSFGVDDGDVLHNLIKVPDQQALILVSATRFPAPDKGQIEIRMRKLCKMLNDKGIDYIWLNFSDGRLPDPPKNFYNMGRSDRTPQIIKAATYMVALSDSECWSYACLEALTAGTPLICTPFPSVYEMGVKDGVNAHIVPFDMDFDVTKLLDVPSFAYEYDNESIVKEWKKILGDTTPKRDYHPDKMVLVEVLQDFHDVELGYIKTRGSVYQMNELRAQHIVATQPSLIRIVGE